MKIGYSILLGETIDAHRIEYRDCERFQIVCPHCREPLFKAKRSAGVHEDLHYLSHYSVDTAYQGICDLRVGRMNQCEVDQQNYTSREQRLRYFLSVLTRTLSLDPIYAESAEKSHWKLNKAPVIEFLKDVTWDSVILPNREVIFDEGVIDYLSSLEAAGWGLQTGFSIDMQKRISRDMWLTCTTSAGRGNYNYLFNHAWLREINCIMNGIDKDEGLEKAVSQQALSFMIDAVQAKKSEMRNLFERMAGTLLPLEFNKVRGGENEYDNPSTYLTRISANVQVEMIGTLMKIPYFELLKQQYGDSTKIFPYMPGDAPISEEEIARRDSFLKTFNGASNKPSGH